MFEYGEPAKKIVCEKKKRYEYICGSYSFYLRHAVIKKRVLRRTSSRFSTTYKKPKQLIVYNENF
jgi:hypothetical protein